MPVFDYTIWDDLLTWNDTEVFADVSVEEVTKTATAPVSSFTAYEEVKATGTITVPAYSGITDSYTFTDVIPAGYMLDKVIIQGDASYSCTFDLGTTESGTEIWDDLTVAQGAYVVQSVGTYYGFTAATTLYLSNISAGGAVSLSLAFVLMKLYIT